MVLPPAAVLSGMRPSVRRESIAKRSASLIMPSAWTAIPGKPLAEGRSTASSAYSTSDQSSDASDSVDPEQTSHAADALAPATTVAANPLPGHQGSFSCSTVSSLATVRSQEHSTVAEAVDVSRSGSTPDELAVQLPSQVSSVQGRNSDGESSEQDARPIDGLPTFNERTVQRMATLKAELEYLERCGVLGARSSTTASEVLSEVPAQSHSASLSGIDLLLSANLSSCASVVGFLCVVLAATELLHWCSPAGSAQLCPNQTPSESTDLFSASSASMDLELEPCGNTSVTRKLSAYAKEVAVARDETARHLDRVFDTPVPGLLVTVTLCLCTLLLVLLVTRTIATAQLQVASRQYVGREPGSLSDPVRLYANVRADARILLPAKLQTNSAPGAEEEEACEIVAENVRDNPEAIDVRAASDAQPEWKADDDKSAQEKFAELLVRPR